MSYLHFIPVWKAISAAKRFGSFKCMEDCWLFDILDFSSILFSWLFWSVDVGGCYINPGSDSVICDNINFANRSSFVSGTSSIDTTCTIWGLETGQVLGRVNLVSGHVKTQLIAHDKEVMGGFWVFTLHLFKAVEKEQNFSIFLLFFSWKTLWFKKIIYVSLYTVFLRLYTVLST